MKIISALGGSGSSYIYRSIDRLNFKPYRHVDLYKHKRRLEKYPFLIPHYVRILKIFGQYIPRYQISMRPDAFWTDWNSLSNFGYNPNGKDLQAKIIMQKDYILQNVNKRSSCIEIPANSLTTQTLHQLVASYIKILQSAENDTGTHTILLSGHWGEFGIFKDLEVETAYLIRDPYNSIISHSKRQRHRSDYLQRGFVNINQREWLDSYLFGPQHAWVAHAETALSHHNAKIIRYHNFKKDWRSILGLPDISPGFNYHENDIKSYLSPEAIIYIYDQTKHLYKEYGFPQPK